MNILVLGGSGFVGRRVVQGLREYGHQVSTPSHRELDLLNVSADAAQRCLQNQEVVVNTVGVMSRHAAILETVHYHAPKQLAIWAKQAGVARWVQLSALGANAQHTVHFVGSKGRGDGAVCESGLEVNIARPSVIYGRGGVSCELFIKLAQLPVLLLPKGGQFVLQPVHVNDVVEGLVKMVMQPLPHGTVVNMVGNRVVNLAEYLSVIRETLHGKTPLKVWALPLGLLCSVLPLTNVLSNGILSPSSVQLLEEGSCADGTDFAALLGRTPLAVEEFAQVA